MTDPGIQSRLQYQEKVTEDLAKQLKAIKALLHNEVTEIKSSLAEQMTEMKQIVMHQDRLYQERIRRLETRVEQISEFSLHLARSKGVGGLSHALTEKALVEEEEGQSALELVAEPHSGNEKLEEDDETERLPGVRGVLQRYRNKIRNVYSFYTSYQASRPLAQVMDMTQFTRMAKDCGLTNSLNGPNNNNNHHNYSVEGTYQWMANLPPPEILWMAVMRRLDKKILRFHKSHPYLGKIPVALDPTAPLNRFSIERHLDLPLEFFPEALVVLSEVKYGKERVDMTPEQILERFLNSDIFPNVDLRASEEYVASSTDPFRQVSAAVTAGATLDASLIQNYASDEVKEELKPYLSKIKATYFSYVRKPKNISLAGRPKDPEAIPNMFLETFVDVIKDHGLFPFISKADIRIIYNTARKAGGNKGAESEDASPHSRRGGRSSTTVESKPLDYVATEVDEGLSIGQFKIALKYLAERIYGAALYHEKYPTPAHRMKKLLSKLYLLTNM